ncbi:chemotaxis response regulator protein-glutamatemethylesterase 3 [Striga asiatica]|uniref:Chemotaxis response regulator protein-glutamatemethylesterase 3 n=1 Tax=Striga asiatica TaxID=4170 RepID=A0A5A7PQC7_STRAF|nr:chemotaxis response regulator protein-glutamatemethylesterase 3 [Striga asiatica]
MSLINCLRLTKDGEENVGLDEVQDKRRPNFRMYLRKVERSWSGNLRPDFKPNFRKMRSRSNLGIPARFKKKSPPNSLHRIHNIGPGSGPESGYDSAPVTPRLVRCSGMRRDWSFENLRRALEG